MDCDCAGTRLPDPLITALRRRDHAASAIEWAKYGVPVLPVWPVNEDGTCACGQPDCRFVGKHPLKALVSHGVNDASSDPQLALERWSLWPDANVGLAMGHRLAALDIDPRNGGDIGFDYGGSRTLTETTGNGGEHRLYLTPAEASIRSRKVGDGVEIKGAGSYIVTAPSRHASGTPYTWQDPTATIAFAPHEFLQSPAALQSLRGRPIRRVDDPMVSHEAAQVRARLIRGPFAREACALLNGAISDFPSASEADYSLALLASFWTDDPAVIRAVLWHSGLRRKKYEDHPNYLDLTIDKALVRRKELQGEWSDRGPQVPYMLSQIGRLVLARFCPAHPALSHQPTECPDRLLCIVGTQPTESGIQSRIHDRPNENSLGRRTTGAVVTAEILGLLDEARFNGVDGQSVRLRPSALARTLQVSRKTVTRAINKLHALGIIDAPPALSILTPAGYRKERYARLCVPIAQALERSGLGDVLDNLPTDLMDVHPRSDIATGDDPLAA